jgi:hypothetical protein
LKTGGHLSYIAPNKFMRAGYGKNTRQFLTTAAVPRLVLDFGDLPIFDATTYPSIVMVERVGAQFIAPAGGINAAPTQTFLAATFTEPEQLHSLDETIAAIGFTMPVSALSPEGWSLERPDVLALMRKLRQAGKPLSEYVHGKIYYGIKTGLNEAFVIDGPTRAQLIADDPRSAEVIKPWLRGRDIKKWRTEWAELYVLFTRRGTDIEKYPAVKRHLGHFREDLEPKKKETDRRGRKPGPYKWFEIQDNIAYFAEFEKEKIVYQEIATYQSFGYAESGTFCNNKCFLLPGKDDFLLGILNSKLAWWFICNLTSALTGGARAMQMPYMEQLPIPDVPPEQQQPIVELVDQILAAKKSPPAPLSQRGEQTDIAPLEAEIDRLVYQLYGLSAEEIAVVEGNETVTNCHGLK